MKTKYHLGRLFFMLLPKLNHFSAKHDHLIYHLGANNRTIGTILKCIYIYIFIYIFLRESTITKTTIIYIYTWGPFLYIAVVAIVVVSRTYILFIQCIVNVLRFMFLFARPSEPMVCLGVPSAWLPYQIRNLVYNLVYIRSTIQRFKKNSRP